LTRALLDARFIDGQRGRLLVVLRKPAHLASGRCVLVVPPFAEEMNKCRRSFTELSQGLAAAGVATVLPDLYGTGDSEGEFVDADLDVWLDDLGRVAEWSATQGWPVTSLLCVRLGCPLGALLARRCPGRIERAAFWQPVLDGKRFLAQFFRLRVAASMMEPDKRESVETLRALLQSAGRIEIAGYEIGSRLVGQLDTLVLDASCGADIGVVHWMEVVRDQDAALPTPSRQFIDGQRAAGHGVIEHKFVGEPFWSSVEIVTNQQLIASTVAVMAERTAASVASHG
jgi:exosortase A-associated hydrolase 2